MENIDKYIKILSENQRRCERFDDILDLYSKAGLKDLTEKECRDYIRKNHLYEQKGK